MTGHPVWRSLPSLVSMLPLAQFAITRCVFNEVFGRRGGAIWSASPRNGLSQRRSGSMCARSLRKPDGNWLNENTDELPDTPGGSGPARLLKRLVRLVVAERHQALAALPASPGARSAARCLRQSTKKENAGAKLQCVPHGGIARCNVHGLVADRNSAFQHRAPAWAPAP